MQIAEDRRGPRPPLLHRVTPGQLRAVDLTVAGLLLAGVVVHLLAPVSQYRAGTAVAALGAAVSIVGRRRSPRLSLGLMAVSLAVGMAAGGSWVPVPLIAFPMYQVASSRERRESLVGLAGSIAVLLLGAGIGLQAHVGGGSLSFGIVMAVAAWFVGDSVRVRRVYTAGLAEQAAQRQREVLERAQRSVAEERLQIAREIHDVVAHSLSVIAVQSGVGRHVIDANPAEAKRALAAVEETSRAALDELRRMLGVLRRGGDSPTLAPAPGVDRLGLLVEQVRSAGIPVELEVSSSAVRALSPSAELSVYRVVQEALTNVVKHAGPASVSVQVRDEADALVVEVVDDGPGVGLPSYLPKQADVAGHHGIVGMRERVALFGGTLTAGPRPEGGFRVLARLSLERLAAP
ncbi:MAG: desK9 [Acidimicrobiaceae bacterium]|nr:desK9 [Acidimicrobiaceae bacterium]